MRAAIRRARSRHGAALHSIFIIERARAIQFQEIILGCALSCSIAHDTRRRVRHEHLRGQGMPAPPRPARCRTPLSPFAAMVYREKATVVRAPAAKPTSRALGHGAATWAIAATSHTCAYRALIAIIAYIAARCTRICRRRPRHAGEGRRLRLLKPPDSLSFGFSAPPRAKRSEAMDAYAG